MFIFWQDMLINKILSCLSSELSIRFKWHTVNFGVKFEEPKIQHLKLYNV